MNAKIQGAQSSRSIGARERRWLQKPVTFLEKTRIQRTQETDLKTAAAKEGKRDKPAADQLAGYAEN